MNFIIFLLIAEKINILEHAKQYFADLVTFNMDPKASVIIFYCFLFLQQALSVVLLVYSKYYLPSYDLSQETKPITFSWLETSSPIDFSHYFFFVSVIAFAPTIDLFISEKLPRQLL